MATNFEEFEKETRTLSPRQKATLARKLIEDLVTTADGDTEELWLKEAQQRYRDYQNAELRSVPGEDAMQRARQLDR